jgi:multiple sugar transport system permease protein
MRPSGIAPYLVAIVTLVSVLFPFYWLVTTSLKPNIDQFTYPPIMFPTRITLEHYVSVIQKFNFLAYFRNSLVAGLGSTFLSLVVGVPMAYSIARLRIRRGEGISLFILSSRMSPPVAAIIPLYFMFQFYGWIDTYQALIMAYTVFNLPFTIWMMRGFFAEMPREIEEAALTDGCSTLSTFFRIALPVVAQGIAATAIFCMIQSWNEFMFALFLTSSHTQTLPVLISSYTGEKQNLWSEMTATGVLAVIPVLVFASIVQKQMVRGLTLGAVKG